MKKKRKKSRVVFVSMLILLILLGISGTYAYFSKTISVTNHISTGDVNIGISEYAKMGQKEIPYENPQWIMPGDTISKIPKIINYAKPCWIRAKITYTNNMEDTEGFSDENLSGFPEKWVKRGDYYYYTEILERKESVVLFEQVQVPAEWSGQHDSQELGIEIRAEAIQAENFQPDFEAMSPWGNQEIQLCVHEVNGNVTCTRQNVELSVIFHGSAHELMAVPDDFFSNFRKVMPGDVLKDTVQISNTTEKEAEIFFYTEVPEQSEEQLKMLKEMKMQIRMNGKLLYTGDLQANQLANPVSLGIFAEGVSGEMEFVLQVPAEWDNVYALKQAQVKWNFAVEEDDELPYAAQEQGNSSTDALQFAAETEKTSLVKTGDKMPIEKVISLFLASVIAIVLILVARRGGKHR